MIEGSAVSEGADQSYNDAVVYASMAQTLLLLLGKQLTSEAWHSRAEMILGELTQLFNTNITHNFVNAFIDQSLRRNYHPETVLDMVTSLIKITGKYPTEVPILRELFDQAAKLGRSELALALFATLKDAQSNGSEEHGDAQSEMYSTLLTAYARSGEIDKLARVWALMKQQNIVPNEAGFTAVLEGYKEKDAEKAAELIMQSKTVPANIYTAMIETLLNENKVDKAAEVFSVLYAREPNKLQRVNKNVLRRLSTAISKDKTVALRNSVMPHLRAAISF
jgi:pentatricopeptide repeat protein